MVFDYMLKVKWARPSPADDHVKERFLWNDLMRKNPKILTTSVEKKYLNYYSIVWLHIRIIIIIDPLQQHECCRQWFSDDEEPQKYMNLSRSVHSSRFCADLNSMFVSNAVTFISEYHKRVRFLKILPCTR